MEAERLDWTRWHHAAGEGRSFYFETSPLNSGITVVRFVTGDGTPCDVPRNVTCWSKGNESPSRDRQFFTLGIEPYELRLQGEPFFNFVPQLYARQVPVVKQRTVRIERVVAK